MEDSHTYLYYTIDYTTEGLTVLGYLFITFKLASWEILQANLQNLQETKSKDMNNFEEFNFEKSQAGSEPGVYYVAPALSRSSYLDT